MGIVVRGQDETLGWTVALKVLRPDLAHAAARARFVREARLAAQCKHDHVVSVYAVVNPPDGSPFLVMEYRRPDPGGNDPRPQTAGTARGGDAGCPGRPGTGCRSRRWADPPRRKAGQRHA